MRSFEELTDSDDGTGGVGAWIPADVYADLILDGVVCYGKLSGVITAMEYDFTAGGGDTIQVRYVSPRTSPSCASTTGVCNCLSDTSTTFGTYNIPVKPWGDYDLVCGYSIWEAKGNVVALILNEMAKRMAKCRDEYIWDRLTTGVTPNIDQESAVVCSDGVIETSCCTYTYDLYNSIVTVKQHMKGECYEPDYVIMHPEVAAYLYFKESGSAPFMAFMPGIKFDDKGNLLEVAGLKVIETGAAERCSDTSGEVMAVVIDSSRAIGEVWGKRPTFNEFYDAKCDRYEEVLWQYWGAEHLDQNAIGWISNP